LNTNTEDLNMTTQDLIKQLRELNLVGPVTNELILDAADRLADLLQRIEHEQQRAASHYAGVRRVLEDLRIAKEERDEYLAAKIHGMNRVDELINERDDARAEVERVR